jgi:sigma-B regulation protein RsbU (phosphoserine phosphatase)
MSSTLEKKKQQTPRMPDAKVNKLINRLRLKDFKLSSLLEITKAINNNFSQEKLLEIYEYILREQLGISKLTLFIYDGQADWNCLIKYGTRTRAKQINVEEDLSHIREITVIESSSKEFLHSFDIAIPVFHKDQPLAYLLIGDLNEDAVKISPTIKHMPFIQTLTNIIVVAIENKRLAKDIIKQEVYRKELEVASALQGQLFPSTFPSNDIIDIAARYEAHYQVCGDYYDYIRLNKNEFVFCIGDVSGKGVGAALLMSNFQANLRAIVMYSNVALPEVIVALNDRVMESAKGEKFITFFLGKYNMHTKQLQYINAGHNPPVLTDGDGAIILTKGCTGLGMFEQLPSVEMGEVEVVPNTALVAYTDGLVEMENNAGKQFGSERLIDIIHQNYQLNMSDLNNLIFTELEIYKEDQPYLDDTAILSLRIF